MAMAFSNSKHVTLDLNERSNGKISDILREHFSRLIYRRENLIKTAVFTNIIYI